MQINTLGGLLRGVGELAGELITTDKERLQLEIEAQRTQQAIPLAQIEVNKTEATNVHWFVSGWRPWVGWVCGTGLAYAVIVEPIARFVARVMFGYEGDFPEIDVMLMLEVLLGMLGLGGLRTFEKVRGVGS